MRIEVSSSEREVFIRFDGITHFRCDRRELIGLQSWVVNRGRVTPVYSIQLYVRSGIDIVLEYDSQDKWKKVLAGLETTPFLNEWRIQDP
jgi:hypothetical protein